MLKHILVVSTLAIMSQSMAMGSYEKTCALKSLPHNTFPCNDRKIPTPDEPINQAIPDTQTLDENTPDSTGQEQKEDEPSQDGIEPSPESEPEVYEE